MKNEQSPRRNGRLAAYLGSIVAVGALAAAGWLLLRPSDGGETEIPPAPLVQGTSAFGGVAIDQASVDLGRVPLDTEIKHAWTLTNTGSARANLGKASIETLEGC